VFAIEVEQRFRASSDLNNGRCGTPLQLPTALVEQEARIMDNSYIGIEDQTPSIYSNILCTASQLE
jgi:hypothetical protein